MDPKGLDFFRSSIDSNHDSWLTIVRHIASLLRGESMSSALNRVAMSLMSIEIWIKDIAIECDEVFRNQASQSMLPPLVGNNSLFGGGISTCT